MYVITFQLQPQAAGPVGIAVTWLKPDRHGGLSLQGQASVPAAQMYLGIFWFSSPPLLSFAGFHAPLPVTTLIGWMETARSLLSLAWT